MSARKAVMQSADDCDEFPFTSAPQTEQARDPAEVAAHNIQVVNALLEELDGIGDREGVVVVGACNHSDRLNPALM
ncbi:AAA family ATPase [Azospirillum sp. YIM DDC1]|uniref:AAA family ATPase n=1 Tax=Azospirillum aestuarii TaxID=2802052 RepID=A0ABS1HSA8_9PROT|nr:AAA family ATPase [Azospirillum aestuarii]MBK4717630.1 AAA family ATPase [Azospirillum aestuarii]